jgi:hypothetical protein
MRGFMIRTLTEGRAAHTPELRQDAAILGRGAGLS